jgi:hypothetical protein
MTPTRKFMLETPADVLALLGARVFLFAGHKPMKKMCDNCPFRPKDQGGIDLAPGRLDEIKMSILLGQSFHCHKTVYRPYDEDYDAVTLNRKDDYSFHPAWQVCRGGLDWATAYLEASGRKVSINGDDTA